MKLLIALGTLVVAVLARQLREMPECAVGCINDSVAAVTQCVPGDMKCTCLHFADVQDHASDCVVSSCGDDVADNQVTPAAMALCIAQEDSSPPGTGNRTDWF